MTEAPSAEDLTPELSVRVTNMVLLYFEKLRGRSALDELWRREQIQVPLAYLRDHANFVSLRFVERLTELLARESGAPDFVRKSAEMFSTPEAMGFLYFLLRAVGTPRSVFRKIIELGPTFNRAGGFVVEEEGPNRMRLAYTSRVQERNRNFCIGRMAQLASLPTIWRLPQAYIEETECQVRGGECCRYALRWQEPSRGLFKFLGLVVGLAAGWWIAWLGGGSRAVLLTVNGLLGWSLGGWIDLRRKLGQRDAFLAEQNEGLTRSMFDLQHRTQELHQLNLELESRVNERTSDLAQSKVQLEQALQSARELDRLKTEFFDNISHELRTPLSLILLSLESLTGKDGQPGPVALRQHLDTMERSASRLLRLINQLLDLAKLEAGKMRLRYEPVELHALLSGLLIPFEQLARKSGVELVLEGNPAERVQVDAERIDVVFQNLLSNALKFTRSGGRVTVSVRELPEAVEVTVADTGVGIPAGDLPVIFDRFAQADSRGIKRFGGTGIGLALVKETLEVHGGSISVTSTVDVGTHFTVRLPRGTAHIREELRERRSSEQPVARERRAPTEPLQQVRPRADAAPVAAPAEPELAPAEAPLVLVVEDDPDLRRVIASSLRMRYRVIEAHDGVEGAEKVAAERPDLVVTDLMMPRRSGIQLIRQLREDPATADLPALLLTARRETESLVEALGSGANDFLGKPFSARELMARVDVQLRLREAAVRSAAAERLSALGLLTSGFAHEVRNPLNGLLNAVEPLRASVQAGAAHDAEMLLDVMRECGERVQKLAESLLGFARPTAPDAPVDVATSLESTLSVLGWRLAPGVNLVRQLGANPPVHGDASALGQVWLNLLDNALRAIGRDGTVTVRTAEVDGELQVSIHDTGPGIAPSVQANLFQPFFSTRPAGEGTGLGLALSRRIVHAHGGRIGVESAPGKGTTFTVALPIARARPSQASA